ncbi:chemotaxis protein CheB [Variovorax sp. ZT4R33]|uniref:chemotaxis protein CheB n=1 Tax=Variovorax sp. ZT4R33 TaxID=3443743 RepID=UPI003F4621D6
MSIRYAAVLIGGSTGALPALERLLNALPADFPIAVVVSLRCPKTAAEATPEKLGRHTPLAVLPVQAGTPPAPGTVYIAPAGRHPVFRRGGVLSLDETAIDKPIDALFTSAAKFLVLPVIAVVLSGEDGDGAEGLIALRSTRSVCIVQSPTDAIMPSMPTQALLRDHPDHLVLIEQLGPLLMRMVR